MRSDLQKFILRTMNQYNATREMLAGFEKELAEGKVEESQFAHVRAKIEPMQQNIDRLLYCVYLLDLPEEKPLTILKDKGIMGLYRYFKNRKANAKAQLEEGEKVRAYVEELSKMYPTGDETVEEILEEFEPEVIEVTKDGQ